LVKLLAAALVCAGLLVSSSPGEAWAKPKVHVVYKGQRLGSIAKRYNVTVDELCKANNISQNAPIHPGQKLIIPGTDDGSSDKKDDKKESKGDSAPSQVTGKARIHVVAKGHTLGAISGRYAITITAICHANDINRNTPLEVGQKLVIPHKSDKDGSHARKQRLRGKYDDKLEDDEPGDGKKSSKKEKTWQKYVKPAWRRGYIKIRRYDRSWEGYVIGPKNEVLGHASNKINYVMGAREDGPRIDPKLIRLIASVSDKFGGREMRIVSGYRTKSFVAASKHKQGKAIDFSIPGMPNEALRDYLRTVDGVGVGYYPNSSFVHLDVRGYNSYWIDYSGPGQAPRKGKKSKGKGKGKGKEDSSKDDDDDHDHEYDPDADKQDDGSDGEEKGDSSGESEKKAPESKK
jgi:LysM repeat protein